MAIGINDAHIELSKVARSFLEDADAKGAARALLDTPDETLPGFWDPMAQLGWLGLHVGESFGGSGFGLPELLIVAEELGRCVAPGPFLSTVILSASISDCGTDEQRGRWLPGLVDGTTPGGIALKGSIETNADRLSGKAIVLSGGLAETLGFVVGDDLVVAASSTTGLEVGTVKAIDPTRRSAVVSLNGVAVSDCDVFPGAARRVLAIARTLASADAVGGSHQCSEMATAYTKQREQFGRPIAMFQAVKHHCANMLVDAEMATASVWEAGRAHAGDAQQFELASTIAGVRSVPTFVKNAELNIQVHGGIGFTWEHDGHVLLRRAVSIGAFIDSATAADEVARSSLSGVVRRHDLELPPEAEEYREETRRLAEELAILEGEPLRARMISTGYIQPHWPKPWGREASALEQLVIEEEFNRAGVQRFEYGITGWVILTLIQHGTPDQVERWVRPSLEGSMVWCQLFSEPDAGSDAAGIRTRAERVDGGWLITGQKVWTSVAQLSDRGLATVRTDPTKSKHSGITTVVIDMHAQGVEVRPLREATGNALFNEVFFDHVFVPDDDVVGKVDDGWTVARATLGNERVSIGGGSGTPGGPDIVELYRRHAKGDPVFQRELGVLVSENLAIQAVNLRRVERAVIGAGPGPEGNVTKLLSAEHSQRAADFCRRLLGEAMALPDGDGSIVGIAVLYARALTIAGGTSEITRNQIGERILGLPRDPLIK